MSGERDFAVEGRTVTVPAPVVGVRPDDDHVRQRGVDSTGFEVAIGQAALGGIRGGSASSAGAASSAMPSSCM